LFAFFIFGDFVCILSFLGNQPWRNAKPRVTKGERRRGKENSEALRISLPVTFSNPRLERMQDRNAAKLQERMRGTFNQQMDLLRSYAPGGHAPSNPSGRVSSGGSAAGAGGESFGLRDVWVPICDRFQRLRHTPTDEEFATCDIPLFSKAPLRLSAESMKVSTSRLDFDHARMAPEDDGEASYIDPRVQAKVEKMRQERQRAAARQIEKQAAIGNIARMPSIIS